MAAWLKSKAAEVAQVAADAAEVAQKHANDLQQGVSSALTPPDDQGCGAAEPLSSDFATLQAELVKVRKEAQEAKQQASIAKRNLEVMKDKTRDMFQRVKEDSRRQVEELQAKLLEAEQRALEEAGEARHSITREGNEDAFLSEEQLAQTRGELASQRDAYKEKAEVLQEKAKSTVQKVRGLCDEKVEAVLAELKAAAQESEEKLARTESDAQAHFAQQMSLEKEEYRHELVEFQERTRGVVKKLREQNEERVAACTQELHEAHQELEKLKEASSKNSQEMVAHAGDLERALKIREAEVATANMVSEAAMEELRQAAIQQEQASAVAAEHAKLQRSLREEVHELEEAHTTSAIDAESFLEEHRAEANAHCTNALGEERQAAEERVFQIEARHSAETERLRQEIALLRDRACDRDVEAQQEATVEALGEEAATLKAEVFTASEAARKASDDANTLREHRAEATARLAQELEDQRQSAEEQLSQARAQNATEAEAMREEVKSLQAQAVHEAGAHSLREELAEVLGAKHQACKDAKTMLDEHRVEANLRLAQALGEQRRAIEDQLSKAEAQHAAEKQSLGEEIARLHGQVRECSETGANHSENSQSLLAEQLSQASARFEAALEEQRQAAEDQLRQVTEEISAHREEVRELRQAHHKSTMDRHAEAEARLKDAVERERRHAEEQSEQAQNELATQQVAWRQEVNTLRDKARSLMTRVKEQSEERAATLANEIREARAEADTASRQLHDERSAAEGGAKEAADSRRALEESLSQTQVALSTALDKARRAERDLEASFAENRELMAADRKAMSLQQQLDRIRGENFANQKKGDEMVSDLSTQCADLQLAIARRDEDCRVLQSELQECRITVGELEAKASVLEQELAAARQDMRLAQDSARRAERDFEASVAENREQLDRIRGENLANQKKGDEMVSALTSQCADLQLAVAKRDEDCRVLLHELQESRTTVNELAAKASVLEQQLAAARQEAAQPPDDSKRKLVEEPRKTRPVSAEQGGLLLPFLEDVPLVATDVDKDGDAFGDDLEPGATIIGAACSDQLGHEQVSTWRVRVESLEKRCLALQKKLDARPVIYQAPPVGGGGTGAADDMQLEPEAFWERSGARRRPAWELWLRDAAGPVARRMHLPQGWEQKLGDIAHLAWQLLVGNVDSALRNFTKRLLKHDKFLWVFYAHLLLLYMIAASSFATTAAAPDPLGGGEVSIQEAAQVVVRHRVP